MANLKPVLALAAIPACIAVAWFLATQFRPEHDGFTYDGHITTWLLLAPIPLEEGQRGVVGLDMEQIKNEANLRPKAGEKVKVGGRVLVWREYRTREFFIDFNDFLGNQNEHNAGYAVCYVHALSDITDAKLTIGSDDQARVYLNGVEVIKSIQTRGLNKDQDAANVILKRGMNVLVFKVINVFGSWTGCARFIDRRGNPIQNLKLSLTGKAK